MSCAATEQHDELCGENPQKHAQRIDRGVADGRLFARTDAVGIGQRGRVGVGSGQHAHDGEIVEFVAQPRQRAHDEDGDDGDEKAGVDIFQSVMPDCAPDGCSPASVNPCFCNAITMSGMAIPRMAAPFGMVINLPTELSSTFFVISENPNSTMMSVSSGYCFTKS